MLALSWQGKSLKIFMISPRAPTVDAYWHDIEETIQWSDAFGATGLLLFTGNDTFVDPWAATIAIMERTQRLTALVAVNPIYMHPFSTAKMVSGIAYVYGRKLYLNLVTGTAVNYLHQLNDKLEHDERYARLEEYGELMTKLLAGKPVTHAGTYYTVEGLHLRPKPSDELMPEFFVAGHSEAAGRVATTMQAIQMRMLPPSLAKGLPRGTRGVNLGIVTREDETKAWEAAHALYPKDELGRMLHDMAMDNTDSVWKHRLKQVADLQADAHEGFWLRPFGDFQSDCPTFVSSYDRVATLLTDLTRSGIEALIIDLARPEKSEFEHIANAFERAQSSLLGA
ncbi:4-(gamma-L-glutamylamino)butanoyl-[BtrI acyl-carrier protein] monooxygenase BtrO [Candidatus Entotheonellaceae bacterium PAL068K]